MGITSQQAMLLSVLVIVTISTSIPTNNAQLHLISHSLPLPHSSLVHPPSPSPSPVPSPSHHHQRHHHHPHHTLSPSLAPSPSYFSATPPQQPSKPVIPSPPPASPPVKPPTTKPSIKPPTTKPTNPPAKAPVAAPTTSPTGKRKFVAVQGMVYCKNCTYSGVNTLLGASPLPGARVVIRCRNTQYIIRKTTTTDKNGYFFLEAPRLVTTYGAHKCKVYLAHKPKPNNSGPCSNVTDLNNGDSGVFLFSNNTGPPKPLPTFSLFSVGPFAYESPKC